MAGNIFDILNKARPPVEKAPEQPRRNADLRAFLLDILADGPVLTTRIIERGKMQGFTRRQILHGRDRNTARLNIIALKQRGVRWGKWMWVLAPHTREALRAPSTERATP
jgi:hypothetical protein